MILLRIFLIILFYFVNIYANWVLLQSPTSENLYSVYFTSQNRGFVIGSHGSIYKTTDGGNTWSKISITNHTLWQVFFSDYYHGWICGYNIILSTNDGGETWETQYSQDNSVYPVTIVKSLYFINNNFGYAGIEKWKGSGTDDYRLAVWKTTNGGNSWTEIWKGTSYPDHCHKIAFKNEQEGWIAGEASNLHDYLFLHTTDGGYTWENVPNPYYAIQARYELFILNNWIFNAGYVSSGTCKLMRSSDGENWSTYDIGGNAAVKALFFSSSSSGWAGKDGGFLYHTNDLGVNWYSISSPTTETIQDIMFISDDKGWACGNNGLLMKYEEPSLINRKKVNSHFSSFTKNLPNPFNNKTIINLNLKKREKVRIEIYNQWGQKMIVLLDKFLNPGIHKIKFNGTNFPSGIYYYRIITTDYQQTKKMILLK